MSNYQTLSQHSFTISLSFTRSLSPSPSPSHSFSLSPPSLSLSLPFTLSLYTARGFCCNDYCGWLNLLFVPISLRRSSIRNTQSVPSSMFAIELYFNNEYIRILIFGILVYSKTIFLNTWSLYSIKWVSCITSLFKWEPNFYSKLLSRFQVYENFLLSWNFNNYYPISTQVKQLKRH